MRSFVPVDLRLAADAVEEREITSRIEQLKLAAAPLWTTFDQLWAVGDSAADHVDQLLDRLNRDVESLIDQLPRYAYLDN